MFMDIAFGWQMREMDRKTIEEYGVLGIVLMENASMALSEVCADYLKSRGLKKAAIVCGAGNNGGDGFAAARLLTVRGYDVDVLLAGKEEKIKGDALINYNALLKMGIRVIKKIEDFENVISKADIVVDALFGTGFSGEVRAPYDSVIDIINGSGKYVVSVDMPSGVDSDTGKAASHSVAADETVTFALAKIGSILYPGAENCGRLTVAGISIPKQVMEAAEIKIKALDFEEARALLPERKKRSNKGSYGRLFAFCGSKAMCGAAVLSVKSAYRAGCGLVYGCVPNECVDIIQNLVPEAVVKPMPSINGRFSPEGADAIAEDLKQAKAVVIGPGIGQGDEVKKFVIDILKKVQCHAVIDADGLNALAGNAEVLAETAKIPVITPHPGEMARLTGKSVKEILDSTIDTAVDFAKKYNCVVLLKDARTVIASPEGQVYINMTGNNCMSKGGSGDVLTGIIGGLLCQMDDPFKAAVLGAYIHGLCGDKAAEKLGHYGVLAGDISGFLPEVIKNME